MTGTRTRVRPTAPAPPRAPRLLDLFAGPMDAALRLLFEEPSAGRVVVGRHGRVLRANARLQRMVGAALDLSPGTALRLLFTEADRDASWARVAAAMSGGPHPASPDPFSARLVAEAEDTLTASIVCLPLEGPGGAPEGVLIAVQDVSMQSRLEAQLAQSQRLQAAGQLAGGVAHDFNNLLTAIAAAAEAIAGRGALDEETLEDVAAIRASAARGAALVRHLLAFGRQQVLQPRVLALNAQVGDLVPVLRRLLGRQVRLEFALEQPGRHVMADPTALDQVLVNLAVNAREAMPGGGVLTLHTGALTLRRPLARGAETIPTGSYVMLEVQDTGVGIAPEALQHIFEPFFTTRRDSGGTGLGLSTVHGIVRQSGGFLAVESAPGQGTRMRIYLPAWQGEAPPAAPAPPARASGPVQPVLPFLDPAPARRGTVLLVDDEDVVRRVTERALTRHGWHVLAVPSAEAALALLDRGLPSAPAALVTDLVMPGMDGADLVEAARARLGLATLPAVLVSGYVAEDVRERVAGTAMRFLAKPYEIKTLAAILAEVVA